MSDTKQARRPDPAEVESFQRVSLDLLEAIIRGRQEHVVGDDFMNSLRELVINPVRKDLR
jgi:hypothetical protein